MTDGGLSTERRVAFRVAATTPAAGRRTRTAHEHFAATAVDAAFAVIVGATAVVYATLSHRTYFGADDWRIALRGKTLGDYLEPYNGHFSAPLIALYQLFYSFFGFDTYAPWRITLLVCLLSVPVSLYLAMRTCTGPLIAGVVASYILWFPGTTFGVSSLNHYLALTGAIVCAYALGRRDPASDLIVAGALAFSLASSGAGVSTAVACVVYALCTRARIRRVVAIAGPIVLWAVWWFVYARDANRVSGVLRLDNPGIVEATIDGARASADGLGFENRVLGAILLVLLVVNVLWRLRSGLSAAANALTWSAALVAWWGGVAYSRGAFADPETYRYRVVGAVFIVLALLPTKPLRTPPVTRSLWAAALLVLVTVGFVGAHQHAIVDQAHRLGDQATVTKRYAIVANLGRNVVPDAHQYGIAMSNLTAAEYRMDVDRFGSAGTKPASPDQALVDLATVTIEAEPRPPDACLAPNNVAKTAPDTELVIHAGAAPVEVMVRRFGKVPIAVGKVPAQSAAALQSRSDGTTVPWIVSAKGACITRRPSN